MLITISISDRMGEDEKTAQKNVKKYISIKKKQ